MDNFNLATLPTLEDEDVSQNESLPNNRRETKDIQDLSRKRRIDLMRNNFILVGILNFFTIAGLLCCLIYYKWFNYQSLWVGLLYLFDEKKGAYYEISNYREEFGCGNEILNTARNQTDFCNVLQRFELSGEICTGTLILGLILHCIYFGHIIFLALKRLDDPEKFSIRIFKPLFFKISSMALYLSSLLFWALINETYQLKGKVGIALVAGITACCIYLVLLIYYGFLKKERMKGLIIDNLLNPDKYIERENRASSVGIN